MDDSPVRVADPAADPINVVLGRLSRALCRPVESLRGRFDAILGDGDHPVTEDGRLRVESMAEVCEGLLDLTRGYLDLSARARGVVPPADLAPFRLGDLVREVDSRFARKAADRELAWACTLEGPDSVVRSSFEDCLRAIAHLATNAIDYSARGGAVRVVVSAGREGSGGWSATVADDGPGVPGPDRGRVFEPFHRLDRELRSGADRNGLGLPLARALARGLGGDVEIDPAEAVGTRAVLKFPG